MNREQLSVARQGGVDALAADDRVVRQDDGGGPQAAGAVLETARVHAGRDVGEWFHIYGIHPTGRLSRGE